jgi:TolB-like protein/Flp pilus assembly protein TadD
VVLYEMATGHRPFGGQTGFEVSSAILQRAPRALPPAISGTLRAVIERCLEKDAERRYQRAAEVRAALEEAGGPGVSAAAREKSVAVLYFENMSPDKESDYFCAGITDDIIIALSKIKGLRVAPRSDVQPYRNKEVSRAQLGEALRVQYVLEGGVRKAGNKVRITAQLVGVQDGVPLWADRFDFPLDDIFEVQDVVSRKIADALKLSLSEAEKQSLARKPTDDLRAYDYYLRGKELLYSRGRKNNESAIRLFEEAAAIDERFAGAYAGLAEAYAGMFEWYDGRSSWLGRAIEMNEKALQLDPSSLDARFGIAMVYFHQKRWSEAQRALEEILREDEQYQPAHLRLGMIAEFTGDLQAARRDYLRAAELKPGDEDAWRFLTGVYRKLGDEAAAHEASLRVIEVASKKLEASPEDVTVMSRLAEAFARYGGREETHATLRRVMELDPRDGLALYNCACAYALLGEKQDTLLLLRRAFDSGFRAVRHWVRADSAFDALRDDPEFAQLLAELA